MKNILLLCLLTFSINASAVSVVAETTNPSLDTTFLDAGQSHVDTTTGLEWLDFGGLVGDGMTFGHSINSALAAYGPQGWRLASYTEVENLFDMFFPTYEGTSGTMVVAEGDGTSTMIQSRNSWLYGFGTDASSITTPVDNALSSLGLYVDANGDAQLLGAKVITAPLSTTLYGQDNTLNLTRDTAYTDYGVFMVRASTVVPIPASLWLFATGLLGLIVVARKKV